MSHAAPKPLANRVFFAVLIGWPEKIRADRDSPIDVQTHLFLAPGHTGLSLHGYTTYGVLKSLQTPDIV